LAKIGYHVEVTTSKSNVNGTGMPALIVVKLTDVLLQTILQRYRLRLLSEK